MVRQWRRLSPEEYGLESRARAGSQNPRAGRRECRGVYWRADSGAGGIIIPPSTYWPEIQRICDQYGILLVADEVICGFGRTGEWFGSQYFGIRPHLMTIAKGLSSGYLPIGGVLVHDQVAKVLIEAGDFNHGFTYSGHPVAAAVAAENLRILKTNASSSACATRWRRMSISCGKTPLPIIRWWMTCAAWAISLPSPWWTTRPAASALTMATRWLRGRDICFANNLIMRAVHDSLIAAPPLVMSRADAENFVALARRCVDQLARELGRLP